MRPPRFADPHGNIKTSAAWLIEKAGFPKGYGVPGPATLSTKHVLALTNRGGAGADDVLALARTVAAGVRDRFDRLIRNRPMLDVRIGTTGRKKPQEVRLAGPVGADQSDPQRSSGLVQPMLEPVSVAHRSCSCVCPPGLVIRKVSPTRSSGRSRLQMTRSMSSCRRATPVKASIAQPPTTHHSPG